jgi:hypothetical protein
MMIKSGLIIDLFDTGAVFLIQRPDRTALHRGGIYDQQS